MKKLLSVVLSIFFAFTVAVVAMQNTNSPTTGNSDVARPRKSIFRANKDQIKQAQGLLKERGFYAGEPTGRLDDDTRVGLRKYQESQKIKVTGTLNKVTLEKMGVALTDKQKVM